MAWVATAIIGGSVVSAASTAYAANKASQAQTNAANQAAQIAMQQYQTTRGDLAPFRQIGQTAATDLTNRLNQLTAPIVMDQATLEKTPGYQFNLYQGEKAVQNAAAARGLGESGAALKGAATFATGLADNTYQQQFQNAVTNQTNAYNRLKGLVDTGETAAAQAAMPGAIAANTAASAATQAGTAQAAGINTIGGAVGNVGNNIAGYAMYKGLYGNNQVGQPGPSIAMGGAPVGYDVNGNYFRASAT